MSKKHLICLPPIVFGQASRPVGMYRQRMAAPIQVASAMVDNRRVVAAFRRRLSIFRSFALGTL